MRRGRIAWGRLLVAALTLASVTTVGGPGPAAEAQVAPRAASISPAADLADETVVTLTVSGFPPSGPIYLLECEPAYVSTSADSALHHCQFINNVLGGDRADAQGNLTRTIDLDPVLHLFDDFAADGVTRLYHTDDCRVTGDCSLIVTNLTAPEVTIPLSFDPNAPLGGTVTATPSTGLH